MCVLTGHNEVRTTPLKTIRAHVVLVYKLRRLPIAAFSAYHTHCAISSLFAASRVHDWLQAAAGARKSVIKQMLADRARRVAARCSSAPIELFCYYIETLVSGVCGNEQVGRVPPGRLGTPDHICMRCGH